MAPRWILAVVLALLPQTSLAAYCHGSVSCFGFFFYRKLRNGVETSMRIVHLYKFTVSRFACLHISIILLAISF